jgi:hypothetical protein
MSKNEGSSIEKRIWTLGLLEKNTVYLYIDTTHKDVFVPAWLLNDYCLILEIEKNTQDLTVDNLGITGYLSFSGVSFDCDIPWEAIYIISDTSRKLIKSWEADMPSEIFDYFLSVNRDLSVIGHTIQKPVQKKKLIIPSYLRVVK